MTATTAATVAVTEESHLGQASGPEVRVLHFTPHDELCGIAKYQERCLQALRALPGLRNTVFRWSPYQTRIMDARTFALVIAELRAALADHDLLHLQHEFELFTDDQFARIAQSVRAANKGLVVTVHTSPSTRYRPLKLNKLGPRSILALGRDFRERRRVLKQHGRAFKMADALITHNAAIAEGLRQLGVAQGRIHQLPHPVPTVSRDRNSTTIRDRLGAQQGDTVVAIIGFIHRYKGIRDAVQALHLLPSTYRLAVIGGIHASSQDPGFVDELSDLINHLDLVDRVHITGSVEDDETMNALIQECDLCIFPFDPVYYASASSDTMSLALANHMPVIAYPTAAFKQLAHASDAVRLCASFSPLDLAREIREVNRPQQRNRAAAYAAVTSWSSQGPTLAQLYFTSSEDRSSHVAPIAPESVRIR